VKSESPETFAERRSLVGDGSLDLCWWRRRLSSLRQSNGRWQWQCFRCEPIGRPLWRELLWLWFGTVFELSPNGRGGYTGKILHTFSGGRDGNQPQGYLALDSSGNLYGETIYGGEARKACHPPLGCGVVYRLSPNSDGIWREAVLQSFAGGPKGGIPVGGVTFDSAGNLYGATYAGGNTSTGCEYGCGIVFELVPYSDGFSQTVLYDFPNDYFQDGAYPSDLTWDVHGNFFGTTAYGGDYVCGSDYNCGSVFEFSPNGRGGWDQNTVYSFSMAGGSTSPVNPFTGVVPDATGNLFGVTQYGGDSGDPCTSCGTLYEITP
jgi:hypothetical protein